MPFNPAGINAFINAYQTGQDIAQKRQQFGLESKRLEQEKELEEERLKQQSDQFYAQHDIAEKQFELAQSQAAAKILNDYQSGAGGLPSGSNVEQPKMSPTPGVTGDATKGFSNQPISQTPGIGPGQMRVTLPGIFGGGSQVMNNPETQAALRGKLATLEQQPKFDLEAQKSTDDFKRQYLLEDLRLKADATKADADRAERLKVAAGNNAATIQAAHISKNGSIIESTMNDWDRSPVTQKYVIAKDAADNIANIEDDTKDPVKQRQLITALAQSNGATSVASGNQSSVDAIKQGIQTIAQKAGSTYDSIMGDDKALSFMTPEIIKSYKAQINNNVMTAAKMHDVARAQKSAMVKQLGGDPEWVTNYTGTKPQEDKQAILDKLFPNKKKK